VTRKKLTPAAEAAADRIAARLKANPKAAARLADYVGRQAAAERGATASEVVREAISSSGLSLGELARRTGVDVGALSRFMNGTSITLSTFEALAPELRLRVVRAKRRKSR
jgi:hypothetical protein